MPAPTVKHLIAIARLFLLTMVLLFEGCNRVLLDERFHDIRLIGWRVIDDPDTVEGPSRWQVESDGWLHQRSNIWGRRGDFIGRWYGTLLVTGDTSWTDYTFSVKAKPEDDDGFGVVFRVNDSEHFYRLLLLQDGFSGGPITRLDKRDGADYTELWSVQRGFRQQKEVHIQIDVVGNQITGSLDDRVLFQISDSTYRSGGIGLFCYAQSSQGFDDVRVIRQ
ncbi:MAG TPA: hypothetical protein VKM94_12795 [Blastocatellia bacterium]|nr:hypothetical protein [Blastocatellia bacterium]